MTAADKILAVGDRVRFVDPDTGRRKTGTIKAVMKDLWGGAPMLNIDVRGVRYVRGPSEVEKIKAPKRRESSQR